MNIFVSLIWHDSHDWDEEGGGRICVHISLKNRGVRTKCKAH